MMHEDRLRSFPAQSPPELSIFIMKTTDGSHTGVLHRYNSDLIIMDVMWHQQFRSAICKSSGYFYVVPQLEEEEMLDVTGFCRLIHDRHQKSDTQYTLPYALRLSEKAQIYTDGTVTLGDGFGFTCSTFVILFFRCAGVHLVSLENWQRRPDDDARHKDLLSKMQQGGASQQHVDCVALELPCIRVRPEEVAGSGLFDHPPATGFNELESAGNWIMNKIQSVPL